MRRILMLAIAAIAIATPAAAQQTTQVGNVTVVRTGWNADSFAIVIDRPMINPRRCPNPDGYISDRALPGYETYYAAALTAMGHRRRVTVTVDNSACHLGRPKLIGINIVYP